MAYERKLYAHGHYYVGYSIEGAIAIEYTLLLFHSADL